MRPSIFCENESVLLVGEGNFSFSVALCKLNLNINLTCTCYDSEIEHEFGKKNIEYLKTNGIRVLFGMDATKLIEHFSETECFDKIIFNFPHVGGKMRIEKNRELLKNFFMAVERLIGIEIQILLTLCNGQGGTPVDNPKRRWDDSWKVVEMAAHGNFLLTAIEPFAWSHFPDYIVTGYRSSEKQFHKTGALVHFFKRAKPLDILNISPEEKVNIRCNVHDFKWEDIKQLVKIKCNCNIKSIYPITYTFDITFCIGEDFDAYKLYEVLYNNAGCVIEKVDFIGSYAFPCKKKVSKTYRIYYKSYCIPLHRQRVIHLHQNLITNILENNFNISVIR